MATPEPVEQSRVEANAERARALLSRDWRMLVGGRQVAAAAGRTYESVDPATARLLANVPLADADDVEHAVQATERALPGWRALSVGERARCLEQAVRIIEAHAHDIALIDAIDSGNPIAAMLDDVAIACRNIRYFAGIAPEVKGATVPATAANLHLTLREPYGVVGRIIPFNHPFYFASSKVAAPLVTGNTVVLKAPDARQLQTGFVWINGSSRHFPGIPFGGYKDSGVGYEDGMEELLSYTQIKSINVMLERGR
jgi:acyl-CoA reductase-like NAD-dependent aldehyde dehydrogenase